MSQTIIKDHCQGDITVENDNQGAVFIIKLPINLKDKS